MSDKIPTAAEFQWIKKKYRDDVAKEIMIEFAQLHVEAALKAASEQAKCSHISTWNCQPKGIQPEVDKQSILNAYPKTNII